MQRERQPVFSVAFSFYWWGWAYCWLWFSQCLKSVGYGWWECCLWQSVYFKYLKDGLGGVFLEQWASRRGYDVTGRILRRLFIIE
tara:strand:+ start:789 stop:1043 length:255 start_codon:yes stop_codon:yes gene_type:complete